MQCPSCRFQNMPGVEVCGRCGSSLRLATAVVDVHPPRARAWQKRVRRGPELDLPVAGGGHGAVRVPAGEYIDRVLASPGSEIVWEKGQLTVDGVPSALRPLGPERLPGRLALTVPEGSYLILPS